MDRLGEQEPERKQVRKKLRWLSLFQSELVQYFSIWLNLAFLAEAVACTRALNHFAQASGTFQSPGIARLPARPFPHPL